MYGGCKTWYEAGAKLEIADLRTDSVFNLQSTIFN